MSVSLHNHSSSQDRSRPSPPQQLNQPYSSNLNNVSVQLPSIKKVLPRKMHDSPDFQFQTIGLAGKYIQRQSQDSSLNNINNASGTYNNSSMINGDPLKHQNSFTMGALNMKNNSLVATGSGNNNQSYLNPFSIKKTTEQLLIQREQERMQKIKRENSLSQQMSQLTTLHSIHEQSTTQTKYKKNSMQRYTDVPVNAYLKRSISKDPSNSSALGSFLPLTKPYPVTQLGTGQQSKLDGITINLPLANSNMSGAIAAGGILSTSINEGLPNRQSGMGSINDGYYKNLSFQRREGSIRLVNQLGQLSDTKQTAHSPFRGDSLMNDLKTIKQTRRRHGTVNNSIDLKRSSLNQSSVEKAITSSYMQSIDPFIDKGAQDKDDQIIIRDLPPTIRYLTKNAFASTHSSPKENSKEIISHIRSIFYAQMNIENKNEETKKLKEYIVMEKEKLEEARRVFEEDQDKFQKYMSEMEQQADKAREATDKAAQDKIELSEQLEQLQLDINKYDRDIVQVEDDLRQALVYKEFITLVKAQRKFKNKQKKNGNSDVSTSSVQITNSKGESLDNFFITEDAQRLLRNDSSQDQSQLILNSIPNADEIDLSKNEFLDIIQSLEDANIFLLDNIENEEQDLEKFERKAEEKYDRERWVLAEIQQNINMYQNKIHERKLKKKSIKTYIAGFGKTQAGQDEMLRKNQNSNQQSSSINTGGGGGGLGSFIGSESNNIKHLDFKGQMAVLRSIVARLHAKIKNSTHEQPQDEAVIQLGEIERKLAQAIERRDLILYNGEGTDQQIKQIQEVEKLVDKDRKQIRYEKKRKMEQQEMKDKQLKVEKRMERSNNSTKNTLNMRQQRTRSEKPEIIRIIDDPNKNITQEELDYIRYVDTITGHGGANKQHGNNKSSHKAH